MRLFNFVVTAFMLPLLILILAAIFFSSPRSTPLASGLVDGRAPVTITTGSSAALGNSYNSGYVFNQSATPTTAIIYTLPGASPGNQYCVGNSDAMGVATTGIIRVNTAGAGQYIHLNGSRSAGGGYVTSGGAAGDKACFVGITGLDWEFYPQVGNWKIH